MNKQRRTDIKTVISKLEAIKSELNSILIAEENVFDSMPENLQGSMRGEESEEAIDCMNEAIDSLEEAISQLEEI